MVDFEYLKMLSLSFPEVTESPHFEKTSFRLKNKIFCTYDFQTDRATIKLSEIDQDVFSKISEAIYPVQNKWGKQGWTIIELAKVNKVIFKDALTTAYCQVAPVKLAKIVR